MALRSKWKHPEKFDLGLLILQRRSPHGEWHHRLKQLHPHRLRKLLGEVVEWLGAERGICVVRELSKIHETYHRGSAAELLAYFSLTEPRGELVVIIEGAKVPLKTENE